jgi:hypothetical protein
MREAVYTDDTYRLKVEVDDIEVLLKDDDHPLNFPGLMVFDNDVLVMPYGRGRHYGPVEERRPVAISRDGGKTWENLPKTSPLHDNLQVSGIVGQMSDGSVMYIDVFPIENPFYYDRKYLPYHAKMFTENPHWRLRRFNKDAELEKIWVINIEGLPWDNATYENYGSIIELPGGDLMTSFMCMLEPYRVENGKGVHSVLTLVARSSDKGKTWKYVNHFGPYDDSGEKYGEGGIGEPDMALIPNGDIIMVNRTGSTGTGTIHMVRSKDNGKTWSKPRSIGWPGVKPKLRVMSNGVVALSTGRGPFGHPYSTFVLFSIDGTCEKWESPFVFYTGPGCNYTSNMEKDGKLHVFFSSSSWGKPVGTYDLEFQSIKRAVIDVKRTKIK